MNTLEKYIGPDKFNERRCMNILQQNGIVSDLCVWAADVADSDCENAIAFLINLRFPSTREKPQ